MKPSFKTYSLLKPLSWIWAITTSVRNHLFDKGILHTECFRLPVISVGNITVGGTGKSPHTAYIASLLAKNYKVSILSRGYGRHTNGFRIVSASDSYRSVGDEPLMLSVQLPNVCVAVDEDRAHGIRTLINKVKPQTIILDDAFQHRKVTPSINILLVDYNRNILDDCILPAGKLRENARNRERADIIIVTKCPSDLDNTEMGRIESELIMNKKQRLFFTTMEYGNIYSLSDFCEYTPDATTPILAVTGIASPCTLKKQLDNLSHEVSLMSYPDHHSFTKKDLCKICVTLDKLGPQSIVLTTEKDASRLKSLDIPNELRERIYILPITVKFLKDGNLFESLITKHIESFTK